MSIRSVVLSVTFALLVAPVAAIAQTSDHQAVDAVMKNFMRAYSTASSTLIKDVFRSDGAMIGYSPARDKGLVLRSGDQFAAGFNDKPADNEAQRKRSYEIVDVAENLAAVRVNLDYPGWDGVDYVVLMKIDGTWRIASKTWTGKLKP